jgi:hypothetical protein
MTFGKKSRHHGGRKSRLICRRSQYGLKIKVTAPNCLRSSSNPRTRIMRRLGKFLTVFVVGAVLTSAPMGQASAHDWDADDWGGVGIGFNFGPVFTPSPYYYPPPVYYAPPPPAYYAPPPGYYSPYPGYIARSPVPAAVPQYAQSGSGPAQSCNAGSYVCPMEVNVPVGANCYCRGNDGKRVYGSAQ